MLVQVRGGLGDVSTGAAVAVWGSWSACGQRLVSGCGRSRAGPGGGRKSVAEWRRVEARRVVARHAGRRLRSPGNCHAVGLRVESCHASVQRADSGAASSVWGNRWSPVTTLHRTGRLLQRAGRPRPGGSLTRHGGRRRRAGSSGSRTKRASRRQRPRTLGPRRRYPLRDRLQKRRRPLLASQAGGPG